MTLEEVMRKLEELGTEQTKQTHLRHGAKEPLFGVKVGDLKKLVKDVKRDQRLACALYDTGNSDAMYLAGLTVNPQLVEKAMLQAWAEQASWYMIAEYTVAGVAAESRFALELARAWLESENEIVATCGWSTYAHYVSITPDEQLDLQELKGLLERVERTIHEERNRVKYNMNAFVIAAGSFVTALRQEALRVAEAIGKVEVHMGNTACKVPDAKAYIEKVLASGKAGVKKKTCIC